MSDWRRQQLKRSDDPVDQQRYRVELCRSGEHCGCQDEAGPAPVFEVYQERRYRRERDGFDVLQITLEVSTKILPNNNTPTQDAELVDSEVSLAGEWLRTRPWVQRNEKAESAREEFFRDWLRARTWRGRQGGQRLMAIGQAVVEGVRQSFGNAVSMNDILEAVSALQRVSPNEPTP